MAARQRRIIEGRINNGALFPNIIITMTERIRHLAAKAETGLSETARRVVQGLKGDLELVLVASPPDEQAGRSPELTRRLEELAGVADGLKADVCRVGAGLGNGA